jgi:hypothetical protein
MTAAILNPDGAIPVHRCDFGVGYCGAPSSAIVECVFLAEATTWERRPLCPEHVVDSVRRYLSFGNHVNVYPLA